MIPSKIESWEIEKNALLAVSLNVDILIGALFGQALKTIKNIFTVSLTFDLIRFTKDIFW